MTKIVLDAQTRAQLHDLKEPLEIVDEAGRLLGLFTPMVERARLEPRISDEEIQRRRQQRTGRPLTDILGDLEKRA